MRTRRNTEAEPKEPLQERRVKDLLVVNWFSRCTGQSVLFFLPVVFVAVPLSFHQWHRLTYMHSQWRPLVPLLLALVVLLYASAVSAARAIGTDRPVRYRVGRVIFPIGSIALAIFGVVQMLGIVPVHRVETHTPALPGEAATFVDSYPFQVMYDVTVDSIVEVPISDAANDARRQGRCWAVKGTTVVTRIAPKDMNSSGSTALDGFSLPWFLVGMATLDGFDERVQMVHSDDFGCALEKGEPELRQHRSLHAGQLRQFTQVVWVPDRSTPVSVHLFHHASRYSSWELAPGDCAEREDSTVDISSSRYWGPPDEHGCEAIRDFNDQRGILRHLQHQVHGDWVDDDDVLLPWERPDESS